MAKIDVSVLDRLLGTFENASEQEKTASEPNTREELNNAIKEAAEKAKSQVKTASEENPINDLEKMASDATTRTQIEMIKEAEMFGRAMADAYVLRLSEYNGVLDAMPKTASIDKLAEAEAAGEEDGYRLGKWALEQLASVFTGQDTGEEKLSEEQIAYLQGREEGEEYAINELNKSAEVQDFRSGFLTEIDSFINKQAEAEMEDEKEDEKDDDDGEDKGEDKGEDEEEKNSAELAAYEQAGYNDGIEYLTKKAEEIGSWNFLFNL